MKNNLLVVAFIICSMIFVTSCGKDDGGSPTEPINEPTMKKETRSGLLKISQGSTLEEDDLEVVTFAASSDIKQDGSFSVQANEAEKYQLLFFNSKTSNNPVYLGLYDPLENEVMANDTSTALALTLFNPYLIYTNQFQRNEYINAVKQSSKFSQLLSLLNEAYQSNANTALDYDTNPTIYQVVAQLMKDAMENLGGSKGMKKTSVSIGDPPYIEDAAGEDITFVNPRHVWYAAGVYPDMGSLSDVATIYRKQTVLSFNWGWPPLVTTDPEETNYKLGDGYFKIHVTKGGDFSKITQWNDPVGRATICNTAQTVVYLVELVIGNMSFFTDDLIVSFPQHFHISGAQSFELGEAIGNLDVERFIITFTEIVVDNLDDVAYWIWQETASNAQHHFLNSAMNIFSNTAFVFKLLGYMNEQVPFLGDLVFAPKDVTYFVTQTNGTITSTEQNDPPDVAFSITPPAGIIETVFTFDASSTTDDNDNLNDLKFRWDWETDGNWDTGWSSNCSATHSYSEAGAFSITLEVKDSGDLIGSIIHSVNVGGGAGTATHVKLFRDNLPWDSNSMVIMLESLGFTEGTGQNTYEIINSSQMSSVQLVSGEDLVIISNDQNQTFYDNYSAVQVRFTNFVYMGGSMFWEACDQGWAAGSILNAGIVLPGNLTTDFDFDQWNYITDQNLPLVSGLPNSMDHNYASHESFSNLPDGTTVYCINEESEPTLIEFNLGGGWIIFTGQPLEHQYDRIYGSPDMEELLPRIVSYFTGKSLSKSLQKRTFLRSKRASH